MWNNVKNTKIFGVKVLPQPAVDLDQEAIDVHTSAEIRGMIARFLNRISFDLFPQGRYGSSWLD